MTITKSKIQLSAYLAFVAAIFALGFFLDGFWLNRIATFLVYGMAAVAVSMSWGYGGVLNLGQGLFFGYGAYMLAMSLTLAKLDGGRVPEFMILNAAPGASEKLCCITPGSFLWMPFEHLSIGIAAGVAAPVILALVIGYPMFSRRTTGDYVAIITLAAALLVQLVIINNQPLTNGFNGLAELAPLGIAGHQFDPYGLDTYLLVCAVLGVVLLGGRWLMSSRAGLIFRAIQDNESRTRFFGYNVSLFKLFFFCLSAAVAGVAGMLFVLVASFASPSFMAIPFSISMVIWAAVGGRGSLLGACLGGILVNAIEATASENQAFQPIWPLMLGGLFVVTVLFMPKGLAGLADRMVDRWIDRSKTAKRKGNGDAAVSRDAGAFDKPMAASGD